MIPKRLDAFRIRISPEQFEVFTQNLDACQAAWRPDSLSTRPMDERDRLICRSSIRELYRLSGLKPPANIVFVPSPLVMFFAAGFSAALHHRVALGFPLPEFRHAIDWTRKRNDPVETAIVQAVIEAMCVPGSSRQEEAQPQWGLREARKACRAETESKTRCRARPSIVHDESRGSCLSRLLYMSYRHEPGLDLLEKVKYAIETPPYHQTDKPGIDSLPKRLVKLTELLEIGNDYFGMECAFEMRRCWQGGNLSCAHIANDAFLLGSFEGAVKGIAWWPWVKLALHGGPRVVHPAFCMICDRPREFHWSGELGLHREDGPACAWSDGSSLYAWRGLQVPAWFIENPHRIDLSLIRQEVDPKFYDALIARYGLSRFVTEAAELVHEDDYGVLYRHQWPGEFEIRAYVKVLNATPEPDGSFKDYLLRVSPDIETARAAVAWTFELDSDEYDPLLET